MMYCLYIFYISISLIILMNLLIAVMSETAISLAKQMHNRELSLKLSSVSLVSRRLRAIIATGRCLYCLRDTEWLNGYTIGGRSGKEMEILNGRLVIDKENVSKVKESIRYDLPAYCVEKDDIALK